MATLYVTELRSGSLEGVGSPYVAKMPEVADQAITIAGASAPSSAFNGATTMIRVHTDAICSIKIGTNPTAVVTANRMAANQTEYFAVNPGDQIAVIANT